jgi:hypothetical protein
MPAPNYPATTYDHDAAASDIDLLQDEWNQVGEEVQAIEETIGVNPHVSSATGLTHADVDARLESIETTVIASGSVGHRKLIIRNDYATTPNRVVTIDAELLLVEGYALTNLTQSLSLNVSGAGGIAVGGSDTGTVAAGTWYHIYEIYNPANGNKNTLASVSAVSPTIPAGYTKKRRIGLCWTDGAANLYRFCQIDDWWEMNQIINQVGNAAATGLTWNTYTIPFYPAPLTRYVRMVWENTNANGGTLHRRDKTAENSGVVIVAHKPAASAFIITFDTPVDSNGQFEWMRNVTEAGGNNLALLGLRYPMG